MNTSPSKKKKLKISLFLFAILILIVLVGGYEFVKSRVPQMNGELVLRNLDGQVEVIRDQNGIPHIHAKSNRDAFRALGYIMASERLFQMEVSRRLAQGELAEIFGEKALATDQLFRNLGLKSESEKMINKKLANISYDSQMMEEVGAFYDGINQFIESGPKPIEFVLLGLKPRPFSMVDGQSFVGLMGFSFGVAIMTEPLLTKLVTRIGGDLVEDLRNEKIPGNHTRVVDFDHSLSKKVLNIIADLEKGFNLFEGSNGWVLSGKKTVSGAPLFANDPHISYSQPGIWFEAHIKTPTFETYGHFLSLIPFPILSHNRERVWGLTMSLTDDMDIYKEDIDLQKKTYVYKGEKRNLTERVEVIKVKGAPDFNLNVFSTHHGPVLDYALSETIAEKSLALQWTFYDEDNDPLTTMFKMGRAKDMTEFKAAVATGKAPGLNILYADKENIGWWMYGEIWKKRPGLKSDFILNGQSGEDEILGSVDFEDKPHLENPTNGIIISANSRPNGFPESIRGDWQPDDRYKTIENILLHKEKWSPEETMELQTLNMNFENKPLLETLVRDTIFSNLKEKESYEKYFVILKSWNLSSDIDSAAASIYYSWTRQIQIMLLKDLTADEREVFAKVPNGWIFFKRVVLDPLSPWWKKYERGSLFKEALIQTIADLERKFGLDTRDWQWGKLHTLEFAHPFARIKPLAALFNLGPYPVGGGTQEVNNQKVSTYLNSFPVVAGPSTRRIIDFSHPERSWGILPTGNSGHMLSPFYNNQVQKFLGGQYREQLLELSDKDTRFKMIIRTTH